MKTQKLLVLSILLLSGMAGNVLAQGVSATWTASTSGAWTTGSNWSGGLYAGSNTSSGGTSDIATFNTSTGGTVTLPTSLSLDDIDFGTNAGSFIFNNGTFYLESGGVIQLLSSMTSSNQTETFSSKISTRTTANNISITNNASVSSDVLDITGNITNAYTTAGTFLLQLGGTNTGANNIISGIISNGSTDPTEVTVNGTTTFILTGSNTYTGGTGVSAGTLQVNGIGSTGIGSVTVSSGATLGGYGSITSGATASTVTIDSGGTLAPGAPGTIDTLTLNMTGSTLSGTPYLSVASGAGLTFNLDSELTSSGLALTNSPSTGRVTFNNNTINFNDLTAGQLWPGAYTLFTADIASDYTGLTVVNNKITGGLTIGSGLGAYAAYNPTLKLEGQNIDLVIGAPPESMSGRVLMEYWSGISGSTVASLTSSTNYPLLPNGREYPLVMEVPENMDANLGTRIRGYFTAPATGNYTFAIASGADSVLLFSTNDNPASATQIASVTGSTGYEVWNTYPSQTASPIALTGGQVCYIEADGIQGSTNSNLSIGYMPPGGSSIALMPATSVTPYDAGVDYSSSAIASVVSQSRPRLMLSAAAIARLKVAIAVSGSTQATWWGEIQTQANTILAEPIIVPPAGSNFINSARSLQAVSYYLGLDYLLNTNTTIQANCLTQLYAQLQSAANWGHSATNNTTPPGNWNQWQLLDVPEISHAYAIAYDWCYNGWTSTQKTFIRNTIVTNGFGPILTAYGPPTSIELNGANNWPIVINSGMILSALSILGDETSSPEAPTVLNDLMPELYNSTAMAEWSPNGGWPESESYYNLSTRYLSTLFASLETSSATCFNFDKLNGMSSMGDFELNVVGPIDQEFNYGDTAGSGYETSSAMQYFGLKYNQPCYSWRQYEEVSTAFPTDLIWFDPRGPTATPYHFNITRATYFDNAGLIFLRSAWNSTNDNALFVGIKVGFNANVGPYGSDHEDEQIGSFVFDALGVRWACDLGADSYSLPGYFETDPWDNSNRWLYYRCRAEGNNTLVINPTLDGGQSSYGTATLTDIFTNTTTQKAIFDMTSAYATTDGNSSNKVSSSTPVTSAKRGMRFIGGVAQLQDEVTASSAVALNWFMHTQTTISINGNVATLTPSSGTSRLQMIIQSPSGATWASMNAVPLSTSPNPSGQTANTGITKLWIQLPSITSTTLTVAMCPYVQGNTPPTPPAVQPLSTW